MRCSTRIRLAILLFTCAVTLIEGANIPKDIRKKPGKCPHVKNMERECPLPVDVQNMVEFNNFLMSIAECLFDGDCSGADKCCFDGCKTKCTKVEQPKIDELHPGKCPAIEKSDGSNCDYTDDSLDHAKCLRDKECKQDEKCCFDGCYVKCIKVSPEAHPGICPPVTVSAEKKCPQNHGTDSTGEILQELPACFKDDDCNSTAKCCSDGCKLECVVPILPKPGVKLKQDLDTLIKSAESTKKRPELLLEVQQTKYSLENDTLKDIELVNPTESTARKPNMSLELQRTFVMIKPDGVRRGLISDIINRFERKGYKLVAMKLTKPSKDLLRKHYSYMKSKSILEDIIEYVGNGPVVAMVWQGINAVDGAKRTLGSKYLLTAAPGTIRFDFTAQTSRDIVHGSENKDQATKEINLWFQEGEIIDWDPL